MEKTFIMLRALMLASGETAPDLAKVLQIDRITLSRKMNGHVQWKMDEMYGVMDHYHVPHERLHEVFPRDGKNEKMYIANDLQPE